MGHVTKRGVLLFTISLLLMTGCAKPVLVLQNGKNYVVKDLQEELFVYVIYHWKGGRFDDAVELEKAFTAWGQEQGILKYAMGRFPNHDWELGFIANKVPDAKEFGSREIKSMSLPAGRWASMQTQSNTDNMFLYWKKLKKWLKKDNHKVDGPVIEVYPDIFDQSLSVEETTGELRYHLANGG